jgi:hypothetical protein
MVRSHLDWIACWSWFLVFGIWLFQREWLQRPKSRVIEYICLALAAVGFGGVIAVLRGGKTDAYCFLFPAILFYAHKALLRVFVRIFGRMPRDTFYDWSIIMGPDHAYNLVFAFFAMFVPILTTVSVDKALGK